MPDPLRLIRTNGDGTVSDRVTGLMWSRAVDPRKVNLTQDEAPTGPPPGGPRGPGGDEPRGAR